MKATPAPIVHSELAEKYVIRIEAHLARLAQGHDPLGHLLAIERLARAARAEWWEQQHAGESGRNGR
jgi:chorismate-pyruvate lyase